MSRCPIALDIETIGQDWNSLCPEVQTYLTENVKSEAKREEVPKRLGLHPATGKIITIGMWDIESDGGYVLFEGRSSGWRGFDTSVKAFCGSEEQMLREFWNFLEDRATTVVTFNGRGFDAPYLMIRSAILGIEPTRNLVPYRYSFREHCDLMEVLSFWNARNGGGTLDFWCRQFGIQSPKAGFDGSEIDAVYREGRREEIARYCVGDTHATAQLYIRLMSIIRLLERDTRS
jgi:DNA polymerase elongation subunit (family B)